MTVLEILKIASYYLDTTQEFSHYFNGETGDVSKETQENWHKFLQAFNNVVNELSIEYDAFRNVEEINIKDRKFDLTSLKVNVKKVFGLKNNNGEKVSYKVSNEKLEIYNNFSNNSLYKISYSYVPEAVTISSEIDISAIGTRAISLGIASEYLFILGVFDDASLFRELFSKSIKALLSEKPLPNCRW